MKSHIKLAFKAGYNAWLYSIKANAATMYELLEIISNLPQAYEDDIIEYSKEALDLLKGTEFEKDGQFDDIWMILESFAMGEEVESRVLNILNDEIKHFKDELTVMYLN